ncbi:MAG: hypothetical protein Q9166_001502 [cf. Caloplaca sp. 2 TL-2023]
MSKKQFKYQASSSRAASGAFAPNGVLGTSAGGFGFISSSPLSYVYEPPDLSSISEPNLIVAFKNLQKKDSTTKAKALEDLQKHVTSLDSNDGLEDAVLEAWIKVYPRTSIEAARRVRQLAHQLQGAIARTSGKRFVKCMPDTVGAWLAGLFDSDNMVSRAAQQSVKQTFQTQEKVNNVWRIYLGPILQFCSDAVFKQTVNTLSDERTVSPDDASAKHARVVAGAMSVVRYVIENSPQDVLDKHHSALDDILSSQDLWKFASNPDSSVRKAVYRLLDISISKRPNVLDLEVISTCVLVSSLSISQTASALDYSRVLAHLTKHDPQVWTGFYTGSGKRSATKRLCQFLAKGSQGSPSQYWDEIGTVLLCMPMSVLLPQENVSDQKLVVLEALHDGVSNTDEPRSSQHAAWNTYLNLAKRFSSIPNVDCDPLIKNSVMPILIQYISPLRETSTWTVSDSPQPILLSAARLALASPQTFKKDWITLSKMFVEEVQTSLPEQSKDYTKSQEAISVKASRWYSLQAALNAVEISEDIRMILSDALKHEILSAIALLKARNGKPYGAASLITTAIRSMPDLVVTQQQLGLSMAEFVSTELPRLLLSPSGPYLVELISRLGNIVDIDMAYRKSLQSVMQAPKTPARSKALQGLVDSPCLVSLGQDEDLLNMLISTMKQEINDETAQSDLFSTAISNPRAPSQLIQDLIDELVARLSLDDQPTASLQGLRTVVKFNPAAIRTYDESSEGSPLLAKLLALSDSPDETISQQAKAISDLLRANASTDAIEDNPAILNIIRDGPETVGPNALSVGSLVDLAHKTLQQCEQQSRSNLATDILPDESRWKDALQPILATRPSPSLAVMNPLSNAVSMIESTVPSRVVSYDKDGFSVAFRLFWYTTALVQKSGVFAYATAERRACVAGNLALTLQIASDHLSIPSSHSMWQVRDTELEEDIVEIISQSQRLVASWLADEPLGALIHVSLSKLLEDSHGMSVCSYYSSRAYISIMTELNELHMATDLEVSTDELSSARRSADTFTAVAVVSAIQTPATLIKTFNELLAGLTGVDLSKHPDGIKNLIILNSILSREEFVDSLLSIPKQRLVFFVQHMCKELATPINAINGSGVEAEPSESAVVVRAETMQALNHILPTLKETYGTFWEDTIEVLTKTWSLPKAASEDELPLIHASLRLYSSLRSLSSGESNDDLLDALKGQEALIASSMICLLHALRDFPDESHQPRHIVNELLARQMSRADISIDSTAMSELFPVLGSGSLALQEVAYNILHRQIPRAQEDVALDKALSKNYLAKLPEELFSLVLEAPTPSSLADMDFKRSMPPSLRSYLSSWQLIFDHWDGASDAVKNDYINIVKEGSYLDGLLHLASDFLVTSRSRPVDASKFDISSYVPKNEDVPEKDAQWLLSHLYYLALKHLPTLSKTWWRDNTSRQTQISVESWTEKHISPLIISSELATISIWASSQPSDTDQPLTIKVSTSTREITASIPIDEQSTSLTITLPPSYPLSRATVSGLHRVGVTEQKWRSWIITTQGVINFSDIGGGNQLIDGLMAWRKNVTATLKGQTECAICYSVVSADRQLPKFE